MGAWGERVILQALKGYYDRKLKEGSIAKNGWIQGGLDFLIELDKDGNIKDVDTLKSSLVTKYSQYVETTERVPASTPNPPANTGGSGTTLEQFQKMGMKDRSALQAKDPKRYDELSKQAKGAK